MPPSSRLFDGRWRRREEAICSGKRNSNTVHPSVQLGRLAHLDCLDNWARPLSASRRGATT